MAKVLSSISRDSPAATLSASVNDTFSFAGTPGFTGTGGTQRYDFKWEADSGSGYQTIGASGGLTTAGTNPLVNTNSTTQNAITVTCAQAGTYTIRMAGAPTSGGSYTVTSATATITVTAAAQTLSPSLLTNSQTFPAPTVSATIGLAPPLTTNTQTFHSATISQSEAGTTLSPSLVTNSQSFFDPTVSAEIAVSPGLLANTQTFYGPTIGTAISLSPSLATNEQAFFSAALGQSGPQTLIASLLVNSGAIYTPSISADNAYLRARSRRGRFRDYRNSFGRVGP